MSQYLDLARLHLMLQLRVGVCCRFGVVDFMLQAQMMWQDGSTHYDDIVLCSSAYRLASS